MKAVFFGWKQQPEISAAIRILLQRRFETRWINFDFGDEIEPTWQADFLFNFSPVLLSPVELNRFAYPINFHTAPPHYRGRGGCTYALYQNDKEYGVTAHLMIEEVDAGPILQVLRFPILKDDTVDQLYTRTLDHIPLLAMKVLDDIADNGNQPKLAEHEFWQGMLNTQQNLMDFMRLTQGESELEVARKLRACARTGKRDLYIEWRGHRFYRETD